MATVVLMRWWCRWQSLRWWQLIDFRGGIIMFVTFFIMLVTYQIYRIGCQHLKSVTYISKLSPKWTVSNIRQQHLYCQWQFATIILVFTPISIEQNFNSQTVKLVEYLNHVRIFGIGLFSHFLLILESVWMNDLIERLDFIIFNWLLAHRKITLLPLGT